MPPLAQTGVFWMKALLVLLVLATLLAPAVVIARRGDYRRRALLEAGAFFGAAVFLITAVAIAVSIDIPGDYAASVFFHDVHLHGQTHRIEALSSLGSISIVLPVAIAIAVLAGVWSVRAGLYIGVTMLASTAANLAFKALFQPRPPDTHGVLSMTLSAFPSGHAMRTMTLAIALALILPARPWRWPLAALAVLLAALIGLSRVYLGVHYFSDVVGGWALALAVACGVALLSPRLFPATLEIDGDAALDLSGQEDAAPDGGSRVGLPLRVVLFDWGDTLMVDHRLEGPMARWPYVDAVPGATGVLDTLGDRYLIGVATNADDSGADLVEEALGRVGLATNVSRVFSSRDIGARKPDPAFYEAVLHDLDQLVAEDGDSLRPEQVVMIGDSYPNDVAGAKAAGLRAVWFNREGSQPLKPAPAWDAEIRRLDELPDVLERLQQT